MSAPKNMKFNLGIEENSFKAIMNSKVQLKRPKKLIKFM